MTYTVKTTINQSINAKKLKNTKASHINGSEENTVKIAILPKGI